MKSINYIKDLFKSFFIYILNTIEIITAIVNGNTYCFESAEELK